MKKILTIIFVFTLQFNLHAQQFFLFQDDMNGQNDLASLAARGYITQNRCSGPPGVSPIWIQGDPTAFLAYNGPDSGFVGCTYNCVIANNDIDVWLILPALSLEVGDSLSFYSQSPMGSTFPDSVRVMYSPAGDILPEATSWIELDRFKVNTNGVWERKVYGIPSPSANGRLAIRSTVVDGGPNGNNSEFVGIDEIEVTGGDFNVISGRAFVDANTNGIYDAGDYFASNHKIKELQTGAIRYSNPNGEYYVALGDSGNYEVNSEIINYYNAVPSSHTVYFNTINQIDSGNDFALQASGIYNDLCITITPLSNFRPGFKASYQVTYENAGTTSLSPTIILFNDPSISYFSSTATPSSTSGDSVVWNLPSILPFQQSSLDVSFSIPSTTTLGTIINASARIEPIANDMNTYCNYTYSSVTITGSFDPNDILVNEDTLITTQITPNTLLEYIIRFQNTGTDTAFTVRIEDPISSLLDINTIEILASSQPVNASIDIVNRNLTFTFENIPLPDSNINEPESHGFVHYNIKLESGIAAGDNILNQGAIYFDFNPPVITNIASTIILNPASIDDKTSSSNLSIYPNPAKDFVRVLLPGIVKQKLHYEIADITGKKVSSGYVGSDSMINVKKILSGAYTLRVYDDQDIYYSKFIKE